MPSHAEVCLGIPVINLVGPGWYGHRSNSELNINCILRGKKCFFITYFGNFQVIDLNVFLSNQTARFFDQQYPWKETMSEIFCTEIVTG